RPRPAGPQLSSRGLARVSETISRTEVHYHRGDVGVQFTWILRAALRQRRRLFHAIRHDAGTEAEQEVPHLILRQSSGVVGLAARRITATLRAVPISLRPLHLVGDRLPRRADALRVAGTQLLFRGRRSRGLSEGPL